MIRTKSLLTALLMVAMCLAVGYSISAKDEEPDLRLDTKVTLSLGSVTLEQLASAISKKTNVTILIGNSKSDWQAKERRTIVYVKDVAVRDLLQRISKLHHYRLSRSGKEGQWIYTIRQDRRARDEEKALREDSETALYRNAEASLDYMAELSGKASIMSKSELDKLAEKDSYKHFLLTDPLGQAMCDFASKIPAGLINGPEQKTISLDQADQGLKDAVVKCIIEMQKIELSVQKAQGQDTTALEKRLQQPIVPTEILIEDFRSSHEGQEQAMGLIGEMDIRGMDARGDEISTEFPFITPDGAFAGLISKALKRLRAGEDPGAIEAELDKAAKEKFSTISLEDESLLKEKIKLEKESNYALTLKAVHEKTGLPVLSDSYREMWVLPAAEHTLKDVFTQASVGCQKDTSKEGSWLIIKDKLWYKRRAADVPEAYIKALCAKIKEQDFEQSEFQKIAMDLYDEQLEENLLRDPRLTMLHPLFIKETREALRFLGNLSSEQIKLMTGESRLPVESIPVEALTHGLAALNLNMEHVEGKVLAFTGYEPVINKYNRRIGAKFSLEYQKPDGQTDKRDYTLHTFAPRTAEKEPEPKEPEKTGANDTETRGKGDAAK